MSSPRAGLPREPVTIGPYRPVQRIGEGGMGVVHLALDPQGRAVALKVLRDHVGGDPEARARLRREVETLRRVRSPHVAEVLGADIDGDRPWLATRFVPGRTLEDHVRAEGPLPAPDVVGIGLVLAEALTAIHDAGVVHRDVKPANVMLLDGDPVLVDFGIAHVADDTRLTRAGLVMGTPGYLSPEVVGGWPVTPSTDWWGWGSTLAFAASGRSPFGSGPIEVVLDRVRQGRPDLAGVDARLVPVLEAALAPEPDRRPGGAGLVALLRAAAEAPAPAAATVRLADAPRPPAVLHAPDAGASTGADAPTVVDVPATRHAPPPPYGPPPAVPAAARSPYGPPPTVPSAAPAASPSPYGPPPGAPSSTVQAMAPRPTLPAPAASTMPAVPLPATAVQAPVRRSAVAPPPEPRQPRSQQPQPPQPQPPQPQQPPQPRRPHAGSEVAPGATPVAGAPPSQGWTALVLLAALVALAGAATVVPGAVAVVALVVSVLARTVDRSALGLWRRRSGRGARSSDAAVTVLALPWRLLTATVAALVAAVLPTLVAAAAAFVTASGVAGGRTVRPTGAEALAVGAIAGALVAWWGPGSGSLRRGTRQAVRALAPAPAVAAVLALLLVGCGLTAAAVRAGGRAPDPAPFPVQQMLPWLPSR